MNSYHVDFTVPTTIDFDDADVMDYFNITKEEVNETYREKYLAAQIEFYAEDYCLDYSDYNYYRLANKTKKNNTILKVVR